MHRILNFGDIELDAKKSPLALLAQTCSSIGKPDTPSKSIIPPIEKKDIPPASGSSSSSTGSDKKDNGGATGKSTPDRGSPSSRREGSTRAASRDGDKSLRASSTSPASSPTGPPFKPYSTPKDSDSDSKKEEGLNFRTPRSLPSNPLNLKEKASPSSQSEHSPKSETSENGTSVTTSLSYPLSSSVPSTTSSRLTEAEKSMPSLSPKPPGASALAGLASAQAASYSSLYPYGPMFDPNSPAFQAALAVHGGLLGHPGFHKSVSHGAPHHPPCPHPGGCSQCDAALAASVSAAGYHPSLNLHHSAAAAAAAAALGLPYPFLPPGGLPPPPSALVTTSSPFASGLYSSLNSQANSRLPFICNWVSGDSYCGKRFPTSEELLQHLRSHTSAAAAAAAASEAAASSSLQNMLNSPYPAFSPGGLSAHSAAAAAAAAAALSNSALSSPNSPLRRSYPTSLSPVSRYHPYKPPGAGVPSLHGAPPFPGLPPIPGLGPYYSPYANLYGPRLGAPVAPP